MQHELNALTANTFFVLEYVAPRAVRFTSSKSLAYSKAPFKFSKLCTIKRWRINALRDLRINCCFVISFTSREFYICIRFSTVHTLLYYIMFKRLVRICKALM